MISLRTLVFDEVHVCLSLNIANRMSFYFRISLAQLWLQLCYFRLLICWIIWKIAKYIFTFWIVSWIWLVPSSWNSLWDYNRCILPDTANTMPADALVTLEASASAGMVLITKSRGIPSPAFNSLGRQPEFCLPTTCHENHLAFTKN